MPPGMSPPPDARSVSVSKANVPAKPPGLGPPGLAMPGKGGPGKGGKPELVLPHATKYDIVKLCTDIYGLGKLSPGEWKAGCSKVYNQIMNEQGLADYMKGSSQPFKDQLRKACSSSIEHFLAWHRPKIEARLDELCGKSDEGKGKKGSNTGKGKSEADSGKGSKQSGKGTKQSGKASAKAEAKAPEKPKWEKPKSKWEKPKKGIWGQKKEKPQEKTGANMIQVQWQAPEKAASSSDAKVAAMGADPTPAAAPSRGPAGRGRGTSAPAWMTAGLGNAATAAVDKKPEIPEGGAPQESESSEEDLLAETFAERDVAAAKRMKAKPGKVAKRGGGGWKTKGGSGGGAKRGGGGGGGAKSGGGAKQKQGWKKKGW